MLFEISHQISKEYGAVTPLQLDQEKYVDVIDLYADIRRTQIREKRLSDPNRVIRRPATSWF